MLAYAALLAALLVSGFGWTATQFNAIDGKFNAVNSRIDTLDGKIGTANGKVDALDSKIDEQGERLARIETLLSERLPATR